MLTLATQHALQSFDGIFYAATISLQFCFGAQLPLDFRCRKSQVQKTQGKTLFK